MNQQRKPWLTGKPLVELRQAVISQYGAVCWLCRQPITEETSWDIDHIQPRAKGGSDAISNLRPSHSSCNRKRGTGTPEAPPSWPL